MTTDQLAAQAAYVASLPEHLREYWGQFRPETDPRNKPHFCEKQSRKTPLIPWHNSSPCLSCGKRVGIDYPMPPWA